MLPVRIVVLLASILTLPLLLSGQLQAAPRQPVQEKQQVVQELRVTAIVPHHRDIVIDYSGTITQIFSNTTQDVIPDVYIGSVDPKNKKPLSNELFEQYRQLVPEGTAKYGVLYQADTILSLLLPNGNIMTRFGTS